jgi:hypothetical protein
VPQIGLPFGEEYVKLLDFDWKSVTKDQAVTYELRSGQI